MIIFIIIDIDKQGQNGTTIFNILDNTTELWMTKYIIGEMFSSGGATLYMNPSDQTVLGNIAHMHDNIRSFSLLCCCVGVLPTPLLWSLN